MSAFGRLDDRAGDQARWPNIFKFYKNSNFFIKNAVFCIFASPPFLKR